MRHAPPVRVLCGGRAWRWAQAAVYALAAAAFSAWGLQHAASLTSGWPAWPLTAAMAGVAFVTVGAGAAWRLNKAALDLRWDSQQWWAADQACMAQLMVQTGGWVLVRLRFSSRLEPAATEQWLAVSQAEAGQAWHGLLVALRAQSPGADPASHGWAL